MATGSHVEGAHSPPSGEHSMEELPEAESRSWVERREALVEQALADEDYGTLRRISALPGGFGGEEMRKRVLPVLLRTKWFFPSALKDNTGEAATVDGTAGGTGHAVTDEESSPALSPSPPEAAPTEPVENAKDDTEPPPHPDEGQVLLDTKRSFVTYPKNLHLETKKTMQADLQQLIVHVLRLYPTLSYFQGFHDIMSVLYLTFIPLPPPPVPRSRSTSSRRRSKTGATTPLPGTAVATPTPPNGAMTPLEKSKKPQEKEGISPLDGVCDDRRGRSEQKNGEFGTSDRNSPEWEVLRQCAEVVSVCRVRDAMGRGMEPMMGLLKILQRLLRAADPALSRFSSSISPVPTLPFFALSWILCLFSHDIDGLEPVQRMFDFLLARNPISAIYLAVAILIAKKDQMLVLAKQLGPESEDDPSLLHPLFSRLPPLYPDTPDAPDPPSEVAKREGDRNDEPNPYDPIPLSRVFELTDDLLLRYPWDGDIIRGTEIMGTGSVISTYHLEEEFERSGESSWSLKAAEQMTDKDIVRPGAAEPDDEEGEEETVEVRPGKRPRRRRQFMHGPKNKLGTAMAIGVLAVGIGIAMYGGRSGGLRGGWASWWRTVIKSWADKGGWDVVRGWRVVGGYARRILGEVL